ncbi:MAG: hypothetical protein LGR52_15075 [Candidatus Thiosymbion ectosymbiont of Robbea hypermnestra]|nr:hypothetical protein [Candidatus Thiosymbion ectosymbiont of Robbea hypermnestra]
MDEIPECIWDVAHGLVVLYRRSDRAPGSQGSSDGFPLVIELADGGEAYYAGELPADRRVWVVKAPQEGPFRLLFYPPGSPRRLAGEPIAAVRFDDQLRSDPDRPVGMQYRLGVWLFPSVAGSGGQRRPEPEEIPLEVGETIAEGLEHHGWQHGDPDGLAVYRLDGDALDAPRGPAVQPFRHLADKIDVSFTLVPDDIEAPEDLVILADFDQLSVPAIVIDLTAFGDAAEAERENFHFIHRPHDPGIVPKYIHGLDMEILDHEDRRYLCWPCDEACHLDYLGVYHAGGRILRPQGDGNAGVRLVSHERLESTNALIGMFYGDAYRLWPMHEIDLNVLRERAGVDSLATAGSEIRLNTAWAGIEERWANIDLAGADDATAFTLMAYAEFLEQLAKATEVRENAGLPGLMDRNGIPYRRFTAFARRPDLFYALVAEPKLAPVLRNGRLRADILMDKKQWSPTASLAAALEPDDVALAAWVDAESPAVQRALWLFMLAGGEISVWRDLAIPLEATDGGFDPLVSRLREARTEPLEGFVAPTAEDLGLDTRILDGPPRTFPDAMTRGEVIAKAKDALDSELAAVNEALPGDLEELRLDRGQLTEAFATASDHSGVPALDNLKQRVMVYCAPLGAAASELVPLLMELKTRIVLWGLAEVLGGIVEHGEGAEATDKDGPVVPPPPSDPDEPATDSPRVTDPAVMMHWLSGVLEHKAFDYPPRVLDPDGEDLDRLRAEVEGLLEDVEDFWELFDNADSQPLPRWTGTRADDSARMDAVLDRSCRQARRDLDAMDTETDAERQAIAGLLARIERIRSYLVADALWERTKERIRQAVADNPDPELRALGERMRTAGSEHWEGLAAALDDLLATP